MLSWLKKIIEGVTVDHPSPQTPKRPVDKKVVVPPKATAKASSDSKTQWIVPGQSVTVAGYEIPGGMVYVGTQLPTSDLYRKVDPCLINPKLRVDKSRADYSGQDMGYWPSYSDITPGARAAYLEWLRGDRRDPKVYIGYVFLFFYGLERRVFVDLRSQKSDRSAELTQIIREIERLLLLYPDSHSFQGYATRFVEACKLIRDQNSFAEVSPILDSTSWQLPLSSRVKLGKMVATGKPIPADWLLSWYLHSENATRLRTPATRCAEEFQQLLRLRYQKKYGEGMVIKPNKKRLRAEYRPASSGFSSSVEIEVGDLPDVTALTAPLNKLKVLIDDCTDALDPYSRWLGRHADKVDAKAAVALLPSELTDTVENDEIRLLRQWLADTLGDNQHQIITGKQVLAWWSTEGIEKLTKKEATTLAQSFEKLGYGIEPDVRFGGKPVKQASQFVLFKMATEKVKTPSQAYSAAKILLQLAAAIACADNVVEASEQQYLEEHLETTLALSTAERIRLRAHLTWLLQEKLSLRGLKAKLAKMTSDEKAGIANFLISVAGADGHISPKEISMLSKIYPLLGFDADEIYSHIHSFSTPSVKSSAKPATEPATVRAASSVDRGFTIPTAVNENKAAKEDSSGFDLDIAAVKKKQEESSKVNALLTTIFEEEEEEDVSVDTVDTHDVEEDAQEEDGAVAGLDAIHTKFLRLLAQHPTWSRDALESKASELKLLLDGALEVLNDAAFDSCEEPLTDGDDPIELDADVLEQLMS